PTLSAVFVFGNDAEPKIIRSSDPNISIRVWRTNQGQHHSGSIDAFVIKDSQGMRYEFSTKETATSVSHFVVKDQNPYSPIRRQYTSAWYLSSIRHRGTDETITFEYGSTQTARIPVMPAVSRSNCFSENQLNGECLGEGFSLPFLNSLNRFTFEEITTPFLTRITSIYSSLEFVLGSREDIVGGQRLEQIKVRTQDEVLLQTIDLGYETTISSDEVDITDIQQRQKAFWPHWDFPIYVPDGQGFYFYEEALKRRLFLTDVSFIGHDNIGELSYSFDYYNKDQLPSKWSREQDHWGLYNQNGSASLIPQIYVYPNAGDNFNRFRNYPMDPTLTESTPQYLLPGADRSANPDYAYFGSMSTLTNPYGGNEEFIYELNSYQDQNSEDGCIEGGGIRLAEVKLFDGINSSPQIVKSYEYGLTTSPDISSGQLTQRPEYAVETGWAFTNTFNAIANNVIINGLDNDLDSNDGIIVAYSGLYDELRFGRFCERDYDVNGNFLSGECDDDPWGYATAPTQNVSQYSLWDAFTLRYSHAINQLTLFGGSPVTYTNVKEVYSGSASNNGSIEYEYFPTPSLKDHATPVRMSHGVGLYPLSITGADGANGYYFNPEELLPNSTIPGTNPNNPRAHLFGNIRFSGSNIYPYPPLSLENVSTNAGLIKAKIVKSKLGLKVSEDKYTYR
ncbi:MAG: hypothetical protein AAF901_13095, partial [Bacteroidota bacterium]